MYICTFSFSWARTRPMTSCLICCSSSAVHDAPMCSFNRGITSYWNSRNTQYAYIVLLLVPIYGNTYSTKTTYSIVLGHVRQMRLLGFCYSTCTSWVSGLFQGLVIKISSYSMYMYLPKQHTMYMYMCMTYVQTFLKTFFKKLRSNTPHLPCPHIHAYMVAFENMCEIHVRENEENVKKVRPGNMSHKRVDMR